MTMRVPEASDLEQAMKMATQSPEGADYFAERLESILDKFKLSKKHSNLIEQAHNFAQQVKALYSNQGENWDGIELPSTNLDKVVRDLAESANQHLKEQIKKDISMDYAIGDDAEILRSYSSEGSVIENPEEQAWLDSMLNAWLSDNGIITDDGVLYEKGSDSRFKTDQQGEPLRADANKVKDLFSNKSFDNYMKNKGFDMSTQQQDYPKEEVTAKTSQT